MSRHSGERASSNVRHELACGACRMMGIGVMISLSACSGDSGSNEKADTAASGGVTIAAPATSPGAAVTTSTSPRDRIARGDSIFHGLAAGGTCQACHGVDGKGGSLAPNLTDATWLHGDGSQAFLVRIVTSGVAAPKQYPAPMPPLGGASLSASDVQAVAAYVLSIGDAPPRP